MKARTWIGWTVTGLMAALMVLSAEPDVFRVPEAMTVFTHLGYPPYLLLFLGTAKILGVAAVLTPGIPRLKEWAFAGLTFDLTGALYSHLSVGDPPSAWIPAVIGLLLMAASYVAYRTRPSRADTSQGRRSYAEETATTGARVGLSSLGIAPCDRRGRNSSRPRPFASCETRSIKTLRRALEYFGGLRPLCIRRGAASFNRTPGR